VTERSFSAILADRARAAPDEPIVVDDAGVMTAGELDAAASALAHELLSRGVRRDDTVAVSLPNGRGVVIACFGIWRAGATPQPLSTSLTAAERADVEAIALPAAAVGARPASPDVEWVSGARVEPWAGDLRDVAASCWKAPATSGSTGRPKIVRAAAPARCGIRRSSPMRSGVCSRGTGSSSWIASTPARGSTPSRGTVRRGGCSSRP
jgi:bile acid-coenzyme A ligase